MGEPLIQQRRIDSYQMITEIANRVGSNHY